MKKNSNEYLCGTFSLDIYKIQTKNINKDFFGIFALNIHEGRAKKLLGIGYIFLEYSLQVLFM